MTDLFCCCSWEGGIKERVSPVAERAEATREGLYCSFPGCWRACRNCRGDASSNPKVPGKLGGIFEIDLRLSQRGFGHVPPRRRFSPGRFDFSSHSPDSVLAPFVSVAGHIIIRDDARLVQAPKTKSGQTWRCGKSLQESLPMGRRLIDSGIMAKAGAKIPGLFAQFLDLRIRNDASRL